MSNILRTRGSTAPPTRVRTVQTQVSALMRAREGDKREFDKIIDSNAYDKHGMSVRLSKKEVGMYTADQLYEMAYGGSSDYWMSATFSGMKARERQYVSDLIREINVVESIYKCPSCSYDRILVRQEQKGGGDESMTTMFRCTKCGHAWSNSGRG